MGGSSSSRVVPKGFPVSATSIRVSSSACPSNTSAAVSSARLRSAGVVARQSGRASVAARHAASTSSSVESRASAYRSPVVGSTTARTGPEPDMDRPPIRLRNSGVVGLVMGGSLGVVPAGGTGGPGRRAGRSGA